MRVVRWAPRARSVYLRYLRDLNVLNPSAAARAQATMEARIDALSINPYLGRRSLRWPGYHELSLTVQKKLLVYQSNDEVLYVAAFYDTRQDLSVVSPKPE